MSLLETKYRTHDEKEAQPITEEYQKNQSERALLLLARVMLIGLGFIFIYSLPSQTWKERLSMACVGIMVAGASAFTGALLGFLFGIPRTLQQDETTQTISGQAENRFGNEKASVNYRANTNLEQISDWLTKILVGVGLTQMTVIASNLRRVGDSIARVMGSPDNNSFAIAIIIFFLICGFLFGFLWTRLFLPGAFRQADLGALVSGFEKTRSEVRQVNRKLQELERQAELDALALSLTQRQLNPSFDAPPVTQEQLSTAIKDASQPVKVQIFNQAQTQRVTNWATDKSRMEQTIPVFKVLIEIDTENKFHRNHGQLGYALKDQKNPDWAAAEAELTKAIEMRGPWQSGGYLLYEFNRAICKIKQDARLKAGEKASPEVRESILDDLRAASRSRSVNLILNDPELKEWLQKNEVKDSELS